MGHVVPRHGRSSQTRDRTCVSCTGRLLSFFFFFFGVNKMFLRFPNKYQEALNIYSSHTQVVLAVILHCLLKDHASWSDVRLVVIQVVYSKVAQSCLTLCDPMDCSLPGSSFHGILQERILEWVAISFSRGSSWPRDGTQVSCIAGRFFTIWSTREAWHHNFK